MEWADELAVFQLHARGDLAVLIALCALRKAENGRPGRELGVLSLHAPTLTDQARIAAASFRNHIGRCDIVHIQARGVGGLFTDAYLESFSTGIPGLSSGWAPRKAENDPGGLNVNHVVNLIAFYRRFASAVGTALETVTA